MNPVADLLLRHVSIRDFVEAPIPEETVRRLVRAAQQSATDATGQLYSLLWIRDPRLRAEATRLMGPQEFPNRAGALFVLCLDTRRIARLLAHRGERYGMRPATALLFGITDASLFAQSLVLAFESEGLGTCFLGSVQNNGAAINDLLRLPPGVLPLYGIAAGTPAARTMPKPRIPTDLVLHVDAYRDASPAELDATYATMAAATRSGDWLNPIRKYFAKGGVMDGREEDFRALLAQQGLDLAEGSPDGDPLPKSGGNY